MIISTTIECFQHQLHISVRWLLSAVRLNQIIKPKQLNSNQTNNITEKISPTNQGISSLERNCLLASAIFKALDNIKMMGQYKISYVQKPNVFQKIFLKVLCILYSLLLYIASNMCKLVSVGSHNCETFQGVNERRIFYIITLFISSNKASMTAKYNSLHKCSYLI